MDKRKQQTKINKKIGIITHYYDSLNYGGNFQAYALCQFLNTNNFKAEQISFPIVVTSLIKYPKISFWKKVRQKGLKGIFNKLKSKKNKEKRFNIEQKIVEQKNKAFYKFNKEVIPHSQIVYTNETIKNSNLDYDAFITGSDQVWNLNWYNPAYFLNFVDNKVKLSYAASLAMDSLNSEHKKILMEHLSNFRAVSVREKSAVGLLQGTFSGEIQHVLDPTLLLKKTDWDAVKEDYFVGKKYIFAYFLGSNDNARKIAKQFAKKYNLKLVVIANSYCDVEYFDKSSKCEVLFGVSPQQFLSLVENAEYVFTDSFHAVVFSFIYQKQYYVFNRSKNGEMSSRITSILELFNTITRFCVGDKEKLNYLEALPDIDYAQKLESHENMLVKSKTFLLDNL